MRRFETQDEVIAQEIIPALGEFAAEHDIDAIANEVIEAHQTTKNGRPVGDPYYALSEDVNFWDVVQRHAKN